MSAGALINPFLCLDAVFSSTEQYSIKKYQTCHYKALEPIKLFQVKISLIEPFLGFLEAKRF
jgi:hypothetical protein